jgi:hypothetical protein
MHSLLMHNRVSRPYRFSGPWMTYLVSRPTTDISSKLPDISGKSTYRTVGDAVRLNNLKTWHIWGATIGGNQTIAHQVEPVLAYLGMRSEEKKF